MIFFVSIILEQRETLIHFGTKFIFILQVRFSLQCFYNWFTSFRKNFFVGLFTRQKRFCGQLTPYSKKHSTSSSLRSPENVYSNETLTFHCAILHKNWSKCTFHLLSSLIIIHFKQSLHQISG